MIFQTECSHGCLQTGGGHDGRGPWLPAALPASAHREGRPEAGKGHRDPGEGSGALSEAGGLTHTPTQQLTAEKTKTNC